MRGADALVRTLAAHGVERIFALSGNQIMPVFDACLSAGMEIVHVRHEAAAVFMAEAHAQLTGGVGVALVTAGSGAGNAMGALFAARSSDTPVLLLTGDSPMAQDGRGAFQEMDQAAMSAPVTKASLRVSGDLGAETARALALALGGVPGPVHLALPADLLESPGEAAEPLAEAPDPAGTGSIREALDGGWRVLILLGPSLSDTRAQGLAGRLRTATGAEVVAMESPRGLRDPSQAGLSARVADADVIVALGQRPDFMTGFGTGKADWIVVHDAGAEAQARAVLEDRLRLFLSASPRDIAEALCRGVGGDVSGEPAFAMEAETGLGPARLVAAVRERLSADAIVIADGGEFGQWAQAGLTGFRRVINGPSGTIGGALPYAIAAALARPAAQVVALMGDGTAGFHLSEFETAARVGTRFVAVIGNDRRWNAEHLIQMREYGADRTHSCILSDARYDLAASGLGALGLHATDPESLGRALDAAFAHDGPACVNVEIDGRPAPVR